MSVSMENLSRPMRIRWGMISSVGIGRGNSMKAGSKAVASGIANSMLDGWCFSRVTMSFVFMARIMNVANRAISAKMNVRLAACAPREYQFEVRGKNSCTPWALAWRVM